MEQPSFHPDLNEAKPSVLKEREKFLKEGEKRAIAEMRKAFLEKMLTVIDHPKRPTHESPSPDDSAEHVRHGHGSAVGPDSVQHQIAKHHRHD